MSPNANAHWRPAAKRRSLLRRCAVGTFALITGGAIASQYLAGYLFLWVSHVDPRRATPLTIFEYWVYYARDRQVRRRAMVCSAAGLKFCDWRPARFVRDPEIKAAAWRSEVCPTKP